MTTELLASYSSITAHIGFGLHSSARLICAGATWPMIHALTDAGLIAVARFDDVLGTDRTMPIYRLYFP
jgi:hypothetical protein